jgi:hypothetical protein
MQINCNIYLTTNMKTFILPLMNESTLSGLEIRTNARNLSPVTVQQVKSLADLAIRTMHDEQSLKARRDKEPLWSGMWHSLNGRMNLANGVALGYTLAAKHIVFVAKRAGLNK